MNLKTALESNRRKQSQLRDRHLDLSFVRVWAHPTGEHVGAPIRIEVLPSPFSLFPPVAPNFHRDPFDRVLVALAQAHSLSVLAFDQNIPKYSGVKTLW